MNQKFIKNVTDVRGKAGEEWLKNLPHVIETYAKKWSLIVGEPFHLSYNYVTSVTQADGFEAVLKIGFPGDREFISECIGLEYFKGKGVIKLLRADIENCVMLLERVTPGLPLYTVGDEEKEVRTACALLKKLHRPAPDDERLLNYSKNWLSGYTRIRQKFNGTTGPFPKELFELGEQIDKKHYGATREKDFLIHGDFHHYNILSSDKYGWITIDTKGVVGHPLYDVAVYLNNPQPQFLKRSDLADVTNKRIAIFAEELGVEPREIIAWGISQAILSAIWTLEDHGEGWKEAIHFAQLLQSL